MNSCLTSGRGVVYAAGAHKQFKLVSSSSLSQKISYFQANTLQSVAEFYCGVATRRVACCSAHSATRSQSNSHKGPGLGETCFLGNQKPILSCRLYAKYSPSSKGCVASVSCNSAQSPAEHASTSAPPNGSGSSSSNGENLTNHYPPTYVKAEGRVIAIGDLHGDLTKTLQSLELAGVLGRDDTGRPTWVGGNTVVVQIGDVLDRGDCEIGIIMLLRQLHKMAQIEGGAVYMLNGNHESLNVCGDYRYVTAGAFLEAAMAAGLKDEQAQIWENQLRARVRLYSPGGPMAMELSKNPTVLVVNDTVFAHGGLLPEHANYGLERINREVCRWMRGEKEADGSSAAPPLIAMGDSSSIMWNRMYSRERFPSPYEKYHTCNMLSQTLEKVRGRRLVVGHTPQMEGANCECEQMVWRVDVGMSGGVLDAAAEVLEIVGSGSNAVCRVMSSAAAPSVVAKGFR